MNKELKEQAHKEFNKVLQEALHYYNGELVSISNSHIHEYLDSIIDKTVQYEQDRLLQDLEYAVKHTDNIEMKTFLYTDQIIHLITNKSDINN